MDFSSTFKAFQGSSVYLDPPIVQPGQAVKVFILKIGIGLETTPLSAKLVNLENETIAQASLSPNGKSKWGLISIPEDLQDGSYEVIIESEKSALYILLLTVLSQAFSNNVFLSEKLISAEKKVALLVSENKYQEALSELLSYQKEMEIINYSDLVADLGFTIYFLTKKLSDTDHADSEELKSVMNNTLTKLIKGGVECRNEFSFGQSKIHFERAKDLAISLNDQLRYAEICNNLGDVLLHLGNLKDSENYFNEALKIAEYLNNKKLEGFVRKNKAALYVKKGNFDLAYSELKHSFVIFEKIDPEKAKKLSIQVYEFKKMLFGKGIKNISIFPEKYDF